MLLEVLLELLLLGRIKVVLLLEKGCCGSVQCRSGILLPLVGFHVRTPALNFLKLSEGRMDVLK